MLKIILDTLKEIQINDKKYSEFIISLLSEESHAFGMKSYSEATNYIFQRLENVYGTDIIEYCLIERNMLFDEDAKSEFFIEDKRFNINDFDDLIEYITDDYPLEEEKLLNLLLETHKLLSTSSVKVATTLRNFCNPDFCNEGTLWNTIDISNILDSLEDKLIEFIENKYNKKYIKEDLDYFLYDQDYSSKEFEKISDFSRYLIS